MKLSKYLKYKWKIVAAFGLFAVIVVVTSLLSGIEPKQLLYPMILCTATGLLFITVDYLNARAKHKELERITKIGFELIDEMPSITCEEDEEYQKLVRSLCDENKRLSQDLSGKYNDMIDYYSTWAHQIKTPIASMRLKLQNEDSKLSRQLLQDLNRIEQYVNMVMTYLRLDSKDSDYVFKEHNLDEILRPIIRKFSRDFIDKKLSLDYTDLNTVVVTDDKWLSFVIEQLLSNAIKYTNEGSIRIYLDNNVLCIRDTGIGIAPEDLPRVFDKGYTGFNGRLDKRASGIGLYLCRKICDKLGHGITAVSKIGVGTTIQIDLSYNNVRFED